MNKSLILTWIILTIGAVPANSGSQSDEKQPKVPLSVAEQKAELAKLREIFASVDKLPAKRARWVEVQAGPAEQKTWRRGWLLCESDAEIQLLTQDGGKRTFDKKKLAAKKPPSEFIWSDAWAVRNGDFAKYCRDFMAQKKKKVKEDPNEFGVFRFQRDRAEADTAVVNAALLACWASATGHDELARRLLNRALDKLEERRSTYPGLPVSDKLHQFVAGQAYPHSESNWDTLLGGREQDPRESRLRSLKWNRALAKIPYRADHDAILREIKDLESLIAEDKAWKEPSKEEFASLDVKQKVAYWLHHLRDLNVTQTSSPGMCMVLTDSPWSFIESQDLAKKGTPNAAVELKKLGYQAIPQIIAHLDDARPTRCVGFWRSYSPEGYYTLTYGDCCQQIFEAIALHSIYERTSTSGYPIRDDLGKQCKERAEKWWLEFQKKGEKQVLIEGTMRGDRDSYSNAERLVKKFPDAAFEPLREGIRATKEDWIRSNMLNYMREVKDDRVVAFLREQAKGPYLYARVNAMQGLLERGQAEAVAMLVAEWMKLDPEKVDRYESHGPERLQAALAHCGNEKAIAALAAKWKKIPLDWRHRSLESLRDVDKDFARKSFTPAANKAVEGLLISCLDDREEGYRRQRTCDLAANALAVRWGNPKLFDLSAPLSVRNRLIVEVQNVWRNKQGLKPLPLPQVRRIPPIADSAIAPFLKTLLEPSSAQSQRDASGAVERLGLGALPRVRKELASLAKDHPARERLSKLANRLACIVSEIRFSDDSLARPNNMRKAAEVLKNQPLSAKAFVDSLIAIHKLVPAESGGMVIALDRDGDDTGIQLEIRVLPRQDPAEGGAVHLRRHEEVVVDGHEVLSSGSVTVGIGGQETPSEWTSADWKSLVSSFEEALQAPPEKQFQVRVEITRGR
jgi:hypothetical protein